MFWFRKALNANWPDAIARALDKAKAPVRFWWRDDDAGDISPSLERLLSMSRQLRAPVNLAVIPARLTPALIDAMREYRDIDVLVHGWAHRSHSIGREKKCEFPMTRSMEEMRTDLSTALSRLREAFPENTIPVFVPPWNRFPSALAPMLKECGYVGLSTASSSAPGPIMGKDGLRRSDAHFSLVTIKAEPEPVDMMEIAKRMAKQIGAGSNGPFCIVTHHRAHNDAIWTYCEQLWRLLGNHRNAEIVRARAIFC
jgi:hypothetical protein